MQTARRSHAHDTMLVIGEVNVRLNHPDPRTARIVLSELISQLEMKGATSDDTQKVKNPDRDNLDKIIMGK